MPVNGRQHSPSDRLVREVPYTEQTSRGMLHARYARFNCQLTLAKQSGWNAYTPTSSRSLYSTGLRVMGYGLAGKIFPVTPDRQSHACLLDVDEQSLSIRAESRAREFGNFKTRRNVLSEVGDLAVGR